MQRRDIRKLGVMASAIVVIVSFVVANVRDNRMSLAPVFISGLISILDDVDCGWPFVYLNRRQSSPDGWRITCWPCLVANVLFGFYLTCCMWYATSRIDLHFFGGRTFSIRSIFYVTLLVSLSLLLLPVSDARPGRLNWHWYYTFPWYIGIPLAYGVACSIHVTWTSFSCVVRRVLRWSTPS